VKTPFRTVCWSNIPFLFFSESTGGFAMDEA
jgi:hypothetical protein